MTYKGKFKPKYPTKYQGDIKEIVYRSSWELKMMKYCDTTKSIIEWGSEELVIPYVSPWDGRYHRYFPDFYIKVRTKDKVVSRSILLKSNLRINVHHQKGILREEQVFGITKSRHGV